MRHIHSLQAVSLLLEDLPGKKHNQTRSLSDTQQKCEPQVHVIQVSEDEQKD